MIDVSIIIVNYNTYKVTQNCINSIFDYTKEINFEIILVDNNSKDNSYSIFTNDKRIKYIYLENNVGFGKANNIGFKNARGKYLFLLNSDTLLKSNAVKEFFDFMEKSSYNIACVGTIMTDSEGNLTTSYDKFPTIWSGLKLFIFNPIFIKLRLINNHKNINITKDYFSVDFISGADVFLRKSIANQLGLFDPDFFMYFEETEMQYRYKKYGYKNIIYKKPKIIHLEGSSINSSLNNNILRKLSILLKSYYLYLEKSKGKGSYFIFRCLFGLLAPIWLLHPKYSFSDKIYFLKIAYK